MRRWHRSAGGRSRAMDPDCVHSSGGVRGLALPPASRDPGARDHHDGEHRRDEHRCRGPIHQVTFLGRSILPQVSSFHADRRAPKGRRSGLAGRPARRRATGPSTWCLRAPDILDKPPSRCHLIHDKLGSLGRGRQPAVLTPTPWRPLYCGRTERAERAAQDVAVVNLARAPCSWPPWTESPPPVTVRERPAARAGCSRVVPWGGRRPSSEARGPYPSLPR